MRLCIINETLKKTKKITYFGKKNTGKTSYLSKRRGSMHIDAVRRGSTWLKVVRRGTTRLDAAQWGSTLHDVARSWRGLDAARCSSTRLVVARCSSTRLDAARWGEIKRAEGPQLRNIYIPFHNVSLSILMLPCNHSTPEGLVLYYINRIASSVCLSVCLHKDLKRQHIYRHIIYQSKRNLSGSDVIYIANSDL